MGRSSRQRKAPIMFSRRPSPVAASVLVFVGFIIRHPVRIPSEGGHMTRRVCAALLVSIAVAFVRSVRAQTSRARMGLLNGSS